jgi:hypothetical protein
MAEKSTVNPPRGPRTKNVILITNIVVVQVHLAVLRVPVAIRRATARHIAAHHIHKSRSICFLIFQPY